MTKRAFGSSLSFLLIVIGCNTPEKRASPLGSMTGGGGGSPSDSPLLGGAGGMTQTGDGDVPVGIPCGALTCEVGTCSEEDDGPVCVCPAGFGPPEAGCPDVNECESGTVCALGTCQNAVGGFYCECPSGYEFEDGKCQDIDECALSPCSAGASCKNGEGTFSCTCPDAMVGDGLFCKGTSACLGAPCGTDGVCVETPTGHVCQCALGKSGSSNCDQECSELSLDPALEAHLRTILELPEEAGPLLPLHVADLDTLDASMLPVKTLDGLQCWPHLKHLDLRGTSLGSSPEDHPQPLLSLAQLNHLETLKLSCSPVKTLEGLSHHPSLKELRVNNEAPGCSPSLEDASALNGLLRLRVVDIAGNQVTALPDLGSLPSLRELYVGSNALTSLVGLASLQLVEVLSAYDNSLVDVNALESLATLHTLDLGNNAITSLSGILALSRLRHLRVSGNQISDMEDMSALTSLTTLEAALNEVSHLDSLCHHPGLVDINLVANEIATLEPLVLAGFVGTINVSGNPISCDEEADNFRSLAERGARVLASCDASE